MFLDAIKEIIDSMVNFEVLTIQGDDPNTSVMFDTTTQRRYFNIALVDLLSCTDRRAPVRQSSYLGALQAVIEHPYFDVDDAVAGLRSATAQFVDWLNQKIDVQIWLPSINTNTFITISRLAFIKMCGNISKHNVLRLVRVAEELQETLAESNVNVNLEDAMFALDDFYERFHIDIFTYHCSTIAEFLNNIRWGIYEYLQPEFRRSIVREEGNFPMYHYTYPKDVVSKFAKSCYWNLMNEVRVKPYVRRFKVAVWSKLRY